MGEIGHDEDRFLYILKWWQIRAIIRGYRKRERNLWLATRWQTWATSCMLGGKTESPADFMPLPWENSLTAAEREREDAELQKLLEEARKFNDDQKRNIRQDTPGDC